MNNSSINNIKTLNIIWIAMISGLLIFGLLVFAVLIPKATDFPMDATVFYFISVVLCTVGMVSSNVVYRIQVRSASQFVNPGPERLIAHYQNAFIIKMALLEGPALFSVVAGLLTQQIIFLALTVGMLILMGIAKPSEQQFRADFLKNLIGLEIFPLSKKNALFILIPCLISLFLWLIFTT